MVEISVNTLEWLLFGTLRYSMGRMSVASSITAKALIDLFPKITPQARTQLIYELRSELERAKGAGRPLGHKIDDDTWRETLATLESMA